MTGLGRIDVGDGRFFLMAKTMKQMTKAGRDGNRETMVFFGDSFGEASDDVMKTHLPMAKRKWKTVTQPRGMPPL